MAQLFVIATLLGWSPTTSLAPRAKSRGGILLAAQELTPEEVKAKQLSSSKLIKLSSISEEFKPLVVVALDRLDRNRVMQGKPKYETVDGMIAAYVKEADAAGLGWTQEMAESEVVRYLQRQALADEGGIGEGGGDGQDKAAFALLAMLLGLGSLQLQQWLGLGAPPG
jgi:hypothetical protein